ncbi:unnamed protein product [Boreogadus saida]
MPSRLSLQAIRYQATGRRVFTYAYRRGTVTPMIADREKRPGRGAGPLGTPARYKRPPVERHWAGTDPDGPRRVPDSAEL